MVDDGVVRVRVIRVVKGLSSLTKTVRRLLSGVENAR